MPGSLVAKALVSAANFGIEIDEAVLRKGFDYLKRCQNPDGGFDYKLGPGTVSMKEGTTGDVATLALMRMFDYEVMTKGVEFLLKKNGVALLPGRGKLAGPGRIEITPAKGEGRTIETTSTILATGSAVQGLPGIEFDGKRIISSDDALGMKEVPGSLIVLGAGAVGVEFASIYRSFGAEVTLVELLPHLLPRLNLVDGRH